MSKLSNNQRKKRQGVPSIDLDELYNAPNNRGMCSFLERPPEEARLRREQRLAVDKAELAAQAGSTLPFPGHGLEAVAIPQGDAATGASESPGAGDIRQADILPLVDAGSGPSTIDSASQSEAVTSVNKRRPKLEHASVTLQGFARTYGISDCDIASQADPILPSARALPDASGQSGDDTGVREATAVVPTAVVMTGDDMTGGKATGIDKLVTAVDMTPVLTTPDRTTPVEYGPRLSLAETIPDITTPVVTTPLVISRPHVIPRQTTQRDGDITTPVSTTPVLPTPGPMKPEQAPLLIGPYSVSPHLAETNQQTITTPVETPADITTPHITAPVPIDPPAAIPTPVRTTPDITSPVISQARPYNVHRAVLVQDGHSHTEQLLYDILWRSAKSAAQGDAYRLVQIPQSELAAAVRMTTKNLRIALDRLVEKLAIEELQTFDRGTRIARTWKVYSYRSILERRKAAGMEWVIRDRGVRFIDPGSIPVKPTRVVMPEPLITTGVKSTELTPVGPAQTTPVKTTPSLLGQPPSSETRQMSRAPAPPLVATAVIDVFGFIDDDALQTLVRKCKDNAPDATDQEIAELAAMTARRLVRMRNVDNHVGLLITQTAKCFLGQPFAIYRREKQENERRYAAMMQDEQRREDH
jgi:hypothetical protein